MPTSDSILVIHERSKKANNYLPPLREMGFQVHLVENFQQALDQIQIRNYALVLINKELLGEVDMSNIAWMRSLRRQLPIFLLASRIPMRLVSELRRIGVSDYLVQAVKERELPAAVKKLVPSATVGTMQ
jgi:DNA-binding response OmpR family regulator